VPVNTESVTIDKIANGEIPAKANAALAELARNILDPDTKATQPRKIKIEITVKPDEARDLASVEIGVSTKLAAPKPLKTKVFINQMRDGSVVVAEKDIRQHELNLEGDMPSPPAPKHLAAAREENEEGDEE
jgi:hypothetical protein